MKIRDRGKKFLDPEDPEFGVLKVKKIGAKKHLEDSTLMQTRLEGKFNDLIEINNGTINSSHGVEFIGDVFPKKVEKLRAAGEKRKLKVLNNGAGLGLYNEQVREALGDDVKIIGTSLSNLKFTREEIVEKTRQAVTRSHAALPDHHIKKKEIPYSKDRETLIKKLLGKGKQKKVDKIRESILELRDFQEFDVILDTYGELYYASMYDQINEDDEKTEFNQIFDALVRKLLSSGELYIASLYKNTAVYMWQNAEKLEEKYGIQIFFDNIFSKTELLKKLPKGTHIDYNSVNKALQAIANGRKKSQITQKEAQLLLESIRDGVRYKITKK